MDKVEPSVEEMKRRTYILILPWILLSALVTFFIRMYHQHFDFEFYVNGFYIIIFSIALLAAYFKRWKKWLEYIILFILLSYCGSVVFLSVRSHVYGGDVLDNGIFIIWLPLLLIYTFLVLKRKAAIYISFSLLIITVMPTIYYRESIERVEMEFFIQLYIAMFLYILLLITLFESLSKYIETEVNYRQMYLDPLTKIGNRYQIDKILTSRLDEAAEVPFSILFFDIDHFKAVNDQFGHLVGDRVLQELVKVVLNELDDGMEFGRWGGEEFIIIFPDPERHALISAEKIRKAIETHEFEKVGQVTVSFGVTSYTEGDTVQSILGRADSKLYVSKETGRNRVTGS